MTEKSEMRAGGQIPLILFNSSLILSKNVIGHPRDEDERDYFVRQEKVR